MLRIPPAFQPSYAQAEEVARQVSRDAPLSFRIAHVIVRDDSPVRRMAEPDEIFRTQVQQQSVLAISIVAVVIGALLERLEKDKGLDARGLASYLARWPLMEPRHVPLLERGLERYYSGDYISALHILTPQVEGVLRSMLWQGGLTVTGFTRDGAGIQADTLSALLRREDVKESLGTELQHYLDTALAARDGLNLRNDVAHGLVSSAQATKVSCVIMIHLLLCLTRFRAAEGAHDDDVAPGEEHENVSAEGREPVPQR